ncbi:hypothetical protein Q5P01_016644 [Channa striata]|uniref:Peptidase S1 domain-containing protein n=1 Tax=Channa striata TaxID=64152 RepID=A0AA88M815_CHASR|nr:hypothetical protein Q5P01_016644 [Channa striata]
MAFCKFLSVLVLIHNTGGLLGAEVRSGIVGGKDAAKGKWPWMVHLNITSDGVTKWRCGGTILNSKWILTAANCWDETIHPKAKWARSSAWIGSHDLQKSSVRYMEIEYVLPHSNYQNKGGFFLNDIALVKLKKKIDFKSPVEPVTLPSVDDSFDSSSECWITGWGYTDTNVPLKDPETLQELKINIVSQSVCKARYPDLNSDMLCAGDISGGKDACKGDYGGPLVCRSAGGFVQVGIMSSGGPNGCGRQGYPGVYTRVSKHLRFINDYIHHN